jgi:histidinol-phosphatase
VTASPRDAAAWLPFLTDLADGADRIALEFFRAHDLRVDEKPDLSPVTAADREIEALAHRLLAQRHPELGVLGEEEGERAGSAPARLIIDPIDGTRNFVRGIPIFGTLAAIEIGDEVVAGIASAPALRTRWHAARGAGAFRDGRPMRVSGVSRLGDALLLHGNLGTSEPGPPRQGFDALARQVDRTRGFGDFYQHVLVAEGAADLAVDPAAHPWDVAALQVIVEEAGGMATGLSGARSIYAGSLVTSNGALHAQALALLSPAAGATR